MSRFPWNLGFVLAVAWSSAGILNAAGPTDLDRLVPVAADQPIPVQDFFRPPLLLRPELNSAGTHLAASAEVEGHVGLLVCNLATMQTEVIRGLGSKDLHALAWLDRSRLLTNWTVDNLYAGGLFVADVRDMKDLYPVEIRSAASLIAVPRRTPTQPLVWIRRNAYDKGRDFGVVQIDAAKRLGRNRYASPGSFQERQYREETTVYGTRASIVRRFDGPGGLVVDYLADREGQLAFAITADRGVFMLHRRGGGKWRRCPIDLDQIDILGAGDRADELIVVGPGHAGKPRPVQRLDAATGAWGEALVQDRAYDAVGSTLYRHPVTGTVIGVRFAGDQLATAWLTDAYRTVQAFVESKLPGQAVQILGSDESENRYLVAAYSDRHPISYYLLAWGMRSLQLIKSANPWIDPARMRPKDRMKFTTRDGHVLDAFATLPAGASREHPVPLVVLPHGGPWIRDSWGFDPEVQFLASRGYAVLQPSYRGSTGSHWMFPVTDLWAFRKMHDDVTDAVSALVQTGLVDPARMAIMGTSFGGYLAVCGAAFEPGRYRCAITISGVFDWEQVMLESKYDQFTSPEFGILRRNLGDPKAHVAAFEAISPLRHADRIRIPVFVAHGEEDPVVDVSESRRLIAALTEFHVPHEVMLVSGEGHGIRSLRNEAKLYARIEAFLAENLAPVAAPSAAPPAAP